MEKNSGDKSKLNHQIIQTSKKSVDNIHHKDKRYNIKNYGAPCFEKIDVMNKLQLLITINLCSFWVS